MRLSIIISLSLLALSSKAQYKKSNTLTKEGRTYGLGVEYKNFPDVKGSMVGFRFTSSSEYAAKNISLMSSLVVGKIKYNYTYTYIDVNTGSSTPVNSNGTSPTILNYNLGAGYKIFKKSDDDDLDKVAVSLIANVGYAMSLGSISISTSDVSSNTAKDISAAEVGLGIGSIYALTSHIGVAIGAGYKHAFSLSQGSGKNLYGSHPYINIGLRYRFSGE